MAETDDLRGLRDRGDGQPQPGPVDDAAAWRAVRGAGGDRRAVRVLQRQAPGAAAPRPVRGAGRRPAVPGRDDRAGGRRQLAQLTPLAYRRAWSPNLEP